MEGLELWKYVTIATRTIDAVRTMESRFAPVTTQGATTVGKNYVGMAPFSGIAVYVLAPLQFSKFTGYEN